MAKNSYNIARGVDVTATREKQLQGRPGGSNVGQYGNVSPSNMAGTKCGNPGSYPIDTIERAKSALSYAHNAKDPECIKAQVYKKYPSLDPRKK
jgi:hypothetical protein